MTASNDWGADNELTDALDPAAQEYDTRHPETERTLVVQAGKRAVRQRITEGLRVGESPAASHAALEAATHAQQRGADTTSPAAASTPTAYLYLRVSTREQARSGGGEEGYSIPAQRSACTDKARQLGAVVGGTYTDAGESAKTANRPELQRMLKDIKKHRPTYVIVHKIDRLARNRVDDIAINLALKKAGVTLVSCTENVTDTPSGRFLYNIMADMAQFYSDNLAQEVLKGLVTKAKEGGTPHKAPLGYVHKREYVDGIMRSWVEADPQRGSLMTWAFEQYSSGDWTVANLVVALQEKGLTTRKTPGRPERDVSYTSLLSMLRNPYYLGVITYQGVTYQGQHPALVSPDVWLRVQDVLAAHAHAGEKDRKHTNYLRGTIFCGGCGKRLVFSRNVGRGGAYDYFICPKRRGQSVQCPRRAIRVERIEDGIADFYGCFQLSEQRAEQIRRSVRAEMTALTQEAHAQAERAGRLLTKLNDERTRLLQAHYAGAVPLDLLGVEMQRLTAAMRAAEAQTKATGAHMTDVETDLERALVVAGNCQAQYAAAPGFVKRQINQGFFTRLLIDQDGNVERAELTEPFATLLMEGRVVTVGAQGVPDAPDGARFDGIAGTVRDDGDDDLGAIERPSPALTSVLHRGRTRNDPDHDLIGVGVNVGGLVELRGFEPLTP